MLAGDLGGGTAGFAGVTSPTSRRTFLAGVVAAGLAIGAGGGCTKTSSSARDDAASPEAGLIAPFRPPEGEVLMVIGQGEIDDYLDEVAVEPGGFTWYLGLANANIAEFAAKIAPTLDRLPDSVLHLSVNWVPDFPIGPEQLAGQAALLRGDLDAPIDALAAWCADLERPILLRLGYEFDRLPPNYYDPRTYAESFRYVVDRFRATGVTNVAWVWASTNPSFVDGVGLAESTFEQWYPGDAYVDWFGYSMWFPDEPDELMMREARARNKPVILAETTPSTFNVSTSQVFPDGAGPPRDLTATELWDSWWQPMADFVDANRDVIGAWHYIAKNWNDDEMWKGFPLFSNCDARPWGNDQLLERWEATIGAQPYLAGDPSLFAKLQT